MNSRSRPWIILRHVRWQLALVGGLAIGGFAQAADSKAGQLYENALLRYEKKDYAGAIIQLRSAITLDRRMLPVHVLLGKSMLANGEVAGAEVALNEALQLGVNRAEVVVALAQSLIGQARLQEVVDNPRFDPKDLPSAVRSQLLLVQAGAQSDLGHLPDALKAVEQSRVLNPKSADPWLAEVPMQIRVRRFDDAIAAADRAIALAPQSADAVYLRGSIAHAQGQAAQALSRYDQALQMKPDHAEARVARAGLMVDAGRYDDALPDIALARKLAPQDPRPAYMGALVNERKGQSAASRAALADVTTLLDPIPVAYLRYRPQLLMLGGLAHYGLAQYEKARPYLESMVRQQGDSPAAKLLAEIHLADKNADRAVEVLEPYLKAHPGDKQAVILLASAQMAKGRGARAAALLQDAIKADDTPRLRTYLGLTLMQSGRRADALAELENAYRRDPDQVAAGIALADLYLGSKQPAKAMAIASTLTERQPRQAQFRTMLGVAQAQSGDTARARASYEMALSLDAKFTPAELNLARLDAQAGDVDAAILRLNRIVARDDKHVDALIELAQLAERRGREDDAERLLAKAADLSGARLLRPALLLVDHHLRLQQPDAANDALKRLTTVAPDNVAVVLAAARVRAAQKDLPGTQQLLTRASRLAEFDAPQQLVIAIQQLAAGDAKGARYSLSKALQAQPDDLAAKAMMVDVSIRLNEMPQAELQAREIAAQQPGLGLGYALLGDVAVARGQWLPAMDAYRRAHQLQPSSASVTRLLNVALRHNPAGATALAEAWLTDHPGDLHVRRVLADGHARNGQFAAAQSAYEALLLLTPGDADVLNNLANVLIRNKNAKALQVAEQALALKPGAPYIIGTVGWAAFQAGQSDRAIQLLREARLRNPNNPDTRYFLGAVLASKGKVSEARDELRVALRNGSNFAHAVQAQELLQTLK